MSKTAAIPLYSIHSKLGIQNPRSAYRISRLSVFQFPMRAGDA